MKLSVLLAAALLSSAVSVASATTVTFTFDPNDPNATHPYTPIVGGGDQAFNPNTVYAGTGVTFTDAAIYYSPGNGTFPASSQPSDLTNIPADMQIFFANPASKISFEATSENSNNFVQVFDGSTLLETVFLPADLNSEELITLDTTSVVTELNFEFDRNGFNTIDDLTFTTAATPEPSSLVLLSTGILGLAGAARRRFTR